MAERRLAPTRADNGMMKLWLAAVTVFTLLVLTPDAALARPHSRTRQLSGPVELRSITSLQEAFRRDQGKIRMVVLVSPT